MAKKLGPGKCVHCLKDVEERNSDYVFPESWYPDSTPVVPENSIRRDSRGFAVFQPNASVHA